MNSRSSVISFLGACILVHLGITVLVKVEAKKIKVFIVASQSNIERHGQFAVSSIWGPTRSTAIY